MEENALDNANAFPQNMEGRIVMVNSEKKGTATHSHVQVIDELCELFNWPYDVKKTLASISAHLIKKSFDLTCSQLVNLYQN